MPKTKNLVFAYVALSVLALSPLGFLIARAETPKPSPQQELAEQIQYLVQHFHWLPDVRVLLVSDVAASTLRTRLGVVDLEAKIRSTDSGVHVTQAYVDKLMSDVAALQQQVSALQQAAAGPKVAADKKPTPSPSPSGSPKVKPSPSPSPGE